MFESVEIIRGKIARLETSIKNLRGLADQHDERGTDHNYRAQVMRLDMKLQKLRSELGDVYRLPEDAQRELDAQSPHDLVQVDQAVVCAWCEKEMDTKNVKVERWVSGVPTHGICPQCRATTLNAFKESLAGRKEVSHSQPHTKTPHNMAVSPNRRRQGDALSSPSAFLGGSQLESHKKLVQEA
jgi:hypothetical protein